MNEGVTLLGVAPLLRDGGFRQKLVKLLVI